MYGEGIIIRGGLVGIIKIVDELFDSDRIDGWQGVLLQKKHARFGI
jgi:hypothetical protein